VATILENTFDLESHVFTGLNSLTKLVITSFRRLTRIVSLPATLEYIELSWNGINVIESDAFHFLLKLKNLNLDSNELTAETIFPAFSNLANLEHLSLQNNKINSLEGLKAIRLPRLLVLKLEYNEIRKLSKQTFATLPGLVNLGLDFNQISEIEAGAFDGLINLRVLSFVQNKLKTFYFNVFERAANKISSPVNLMDLDLVVDSLESVKWSAETAILQDGRSARDKEKKNQEEDEAARLFAKCGFRNKLEVEIFNKEIDWRYMDALAARSLIFYF
jgi:Leucine-rich repeat (LRR) protein